MQTHEYRTDWETTNHEGIVVGCQELTIHYRVVTYPGHPAPEADVFEVTERAWSPPKGYHEVPTDEGTYEAVLDWVEANEAKLLRHAVEERAA